MHPRHGWRGEAATTVMVEEIPELQPSCIVLVVDDDIGLVANHLREIGVTVVEWHRRAIRGQHASAWIPNGTFDYAFIRLPIGRDALMMILHAVASRLHPLAPLFLYGTNDEGIRSAGKNMEELLGQVETIAARKHSRVIRALRPLSISNLRSELRDWEVSFSINLPDGPIKMVSYPGVFAHGKLDSGTRMLLEVLPPLSDRSEVLDFGCGIGVISAVIMRRFPKARVDMLDIFAPAVDAASQNVPDARPILGDGWGATGLSKYDLVISNPPIHTGKGEDFRILTDLVEKAPLHLKERGQILLVVQSTVPVQRILKTFFDNVDLVTKSTQYHVWKVTDAKN